jgi:hypothetical protein
MSKPMEQQYVAVVRMNTPVGTNHTMVKSLDDSETIASLMKWYDKQGQGCTVEELIITKVEESGG